MLLSSSQQVWIIRGKSTTHERSLLWACFKYLILIKLLGLILNPTLCSCFCKLNSVTVTSIKINSMWL
jgi:hypothetical protein